MERRKIEREELKEEVTTRQNIRTDCIGGRGGRGKRKRKGEKER